MTPKKKAITILDVAQQAGVSPSTVSRVLNGTATVEASKQAAIYKAIEDLNYSPNLAAQGLKRGTSSMIGVLTPNLGGPFYSAMLDGVEEGFGESNFYPLFVSGGWVQSKEVKAFELLLRRGVEAVIVLGGQIPAEYLLEKAQTIPLVIVGRQIAGLENRCITINNFQAAYAATCHLIEKGHRAIVHIAGSLDHPDARERLEGYQAALQDAEIELNPDWVIRGDYTEQSGILAVESLFSQKQMKPFSAIFAANDQMALGARLALHRRGIRVPDDISIMGFDDQSVAPFAIPPLSTVRQPAHEMGMAAASTILAIFEGQEASMRVIDFQIIARESVAQVFYR